jgi:hypothetical protein
LIAAILIFPEHQQEETKKKEYQKLMKVISYVEESGKCKKETITYP